MPYVMIWSALERFLWGIAISFVFMCGVRFINQGRKKEILKEQLIMYGFACSLFCFGIERILVFFTDFQFEGNYVNSIFYGYVDDNALFFDTWQNIIRLIGFTFIILTFEISFKKTRYLLTIIDFLLIITFITLILITPFFIALYNLIFIVSDMGLYATGIIIYLFMRWSRLEFKAIAGLLSLGMILLVAGTIISSYSVKISNLLPLVAGPILFMIGCFITILPTLVNQKIFSRTLTYWLIIMIFITSFQLWAILTNIFLGEVPIGFIISLIISGIYILIFDYLVLKDIRTAISSEKKMESVETPYDVLGIFIKPKKVTEEEVTISKEKKICIVCKGKIGRTNIYLCPDCDTFYCLKCANTLITLENACWVCNAPIDPSKPVNQYKEADDTIKKVSIDKNKDY